MRPWCIIMAQIISLTSLVAFILINYHLWRSVDSAVYSHLSDAFLAQEVTYDELYQSGMQSYTNEDWSSTIFFFERALQEFDYFRTSLTECRLKCQNLSHISSSGNDILSELKLFEAVFKKADCTRRCKLKKLGGRSERIDDAVTDKFLSMTPYSYLQFAYYKNGIYDMAVSAAHTYLQWHPDDDVMQNNLDYYRNMHGIDDSHLINLEERTHHKHFLEAYQAHQDEKWKTVITSMEVALQEYWKANAQCRALCEGKYDNREFMDLYEAIANHYASTIYCKDQCESWLARMNGKQVEDYLPSHFHFLQFAYYKTDDLKSAVQNALTYLIFHPKDEVMLQNLAFYENLDDFHEDFTPRPDAQEYHKIIAMETKMLAFAKTNFWDEDAEEFLNPDKDTEEEDESGLDYLGAEPINPREVNLKLGEGGEASDDADGNEEEVEEDIEEALKRTREAVGHEMEKNSAKYSKDLNHEGGGSQQQHRHGNGMGAPETEEEFPQSDRPSGGTDIRSKIFNGMRKVLQSLMGTNEEESEQMLLKLAKDPKSSDIKDKIKVAIEKMMSSGDVAKSFPREQLKVMMQGLSQGDLNFGEQGKDGGGSGAENFDVEAVGRIAGDAVFPSNREGRMLDIKDYNPMKGLEKEEYFDWVNPPGYESGAPGIPERDENEEEEEEGIQWEDEERNIAGKMHRERRDGEDDIPAGVEYHPDPEEARNTQESFQEETEIERDDTCSEEGGCGKSDQYSGKYKQENQGNKEGDNRNNEEEKDGEVVEDHNEEVDEEEEEDGDEEEGEDGDEEEHKEKKKRREEKEGKENIQEREGTTDGDMGDEMNTKGDYMCVEEEDDDRKDDDYDAENPPSLTEEDIRVQKLLDDDVSEETKKWMDEMMKVDDNAYFLLGDLPDLRVVMQDKELNGTNRVVSDGLAADQECGILLELLAEEATLGNGYKGKANPLNRFESFEGLTVKDAVDAASDGRVPLLYPTVYMHLAERSRQFLQKHFAMTSHLFFSYTHLVCRQAQPGSGAKRKDLRKDLSHPVHADNCFLDMRSGRCHKRLPAFVWRDWSAILYLNQDFAGGEFIFAHFNQTAQSVVNPKCGRLVGFSAGSENLHGVKGVIEGRRCALAMWFTLDPRFREIEFVTAADVLNKLYEQEYGQGQQAL